MIDTKLIDANYDYFQKVLPKLMKKHLNKIAVVKDQKVIKIFNTVAEAHQFTLNEKHQHGHFIIQEINNTVHHISRIA